MSVLFMNVYTQQWVKLPGTYLVLQFFLDEQANTLG